MRIVALLVAVLTIGVVHAGPPVEWLRQVELIRDEEAQLIAKAPAGLVRRVGLRLEMSMNGRSKVLIDQLSGDDWFGYVTRRWNGLRLGGRFHEVLVHLHADQLWVWHDRYDGKSYVFDGEPAISPDSRHVLIASNDVLDGVDPGLVMWRIESTGLRRVFIDEEAGFEKARWKDLKTVLVKEYGSFEECADGNYRDRVLVQGAGGRWTLLPPKSGKDCSAGAPTR